MEEETIINKLARDIHETFMLQDVIANHGQQMQVITAQLEGLFRQMYQACTQNALHQKLDSYAQMYGRIGELMNDLAIIRQNLEEKVELNRAVDRQVEN